MKSKKVQFLYGENITTSIIYIVVTKKNKLSDTAILQYPMAIEVPLITNLKQHIVL